MTTRNRETSPATPRRSRGWLWFDDSKSTLTQKVERAITKYQQKFGHKPTAIYIKVTPTDRLCGLPIVSTAGISLHYLWLEHPPAE